MPEIANILIDEASGALAVNFATISGCGTLDGEIYTPAEATKKFFEKVGAVTIPRKSTRRR